MKTGTPVAEIVTNDDGTVKHLLLRSGEIVEADEYVSAMPVDVFKRFIPEAWSTMPYFRQVRTCADTLLTTASVLGGSRDILSFTRLKSSCSCRL